LAALGDQGGVVSGSHCGEARVGTVWALNGVTAFLVGESVDASVADDGTSLSIGTEDVSLWAGTVESTVGVDTSIFASTVVEGAFVDFCAVVSIKFQKVSGVTLADVSEFTFDSVYAWNVDASVGASEGWVVARVGNASGCISVQSVPFWACAVTSWCSVDTSVGATTVIIKTFVKIVTVHSISVQDESGVAVAYGTSKAVHATLCTPAVVVQTCVGHASSHIFSEGMGLKRASAVTSTNGVDANIAATAVVNFTFVEVTGVVISRKVVCSFGFWASANFKSCEIGESSDHMDMGSVSVCKIDKFSVVNI
jgi:hypothetical protein